VENKMQTWIKIW